MSIIPFLATTFASSGFLGILLKVASTLLLGLFLDPLLFSFFLLLDLLILILSMFLKLILNIFQILNTLLFDVVFFTLSHEPLFLWAGLDFSLVFYHVLRFLEVTHCFLHFPVGLDLVLDVTHNSV